VSTTTTSSTTGAALTIAPPRNDSSLRATMQSDIRELVLLRDFSRAPALDALGDLLSFLRLEVEVLDLLFFGLLFLVGHFVFLLFLGCEVRLRAAAASDTLGDFLPFLRLEVEVLDVLLLPLLGLVLAHHCHLRFSLLRGDFNLRAN
jgi:hypothetical protein